MLPNSLIPLAASTSACKPDVVQIRVGPPLQGGWRHSGGARAARHAAGSLAATPRRQVIADKQLDSGLSRPQYTMWS